MRKKNKLTLLQKRGLTGILFVLPWVVGFILFYVRSLIMTGQFAFNELTIDAVNGGYQLSPVGWENFRYAFKVHGSFKQILTSSVGNMLIDVPLIIFFSLFMAMLLNKKFPGRAVVRAIFFLPVILSSGVIVGIESNNELMASLAQTIEQSSSGISVTAALESILRTAGVGVRAYEKVFEVIDNIYDVALASGIQIIIFLSGLQTISSSMYEAADIEGCTKWESLWKITFPMISSLFLVNWIYTVVDFCMRSDNEVIEKIQKVMIDQQQYGNASAMSWIYFFLVLAFVGVTSFFISKRVYYYD